MKERTMKVLALRSVQNEIVKGDVYESLGVHIAFTNGEYHRIKLDNDSVVLYSTGHFETIGEDDE